MRRMRSPTAFTLLELLLVVVIIGILAAAVIPNLAGRSTEARLATARQDINGALGTALDLYEQHMGAYPSTQQGLEALVAAPSGAVNWKGPYLKTTTVPLDPWGHPYNYSFPGQRNPGLYDLWSSGPDGQSGTDDDVTGEATQAR